ncbi:MAG: class I SAM-dependent methyltransferase [Smithellaceae bacterium]
MTKAKKDHLGNFEGFHATEIYLPVSGVTDAVRDFFRKLRRKTDGHKQKKFLSVVSWKSLIRRKSVFLQESKKCDGGVRVSELGVLCQFARHLKPGSQIFEIGTCDGRTTLNLALNAPGCCILTLDLPAGQETLFGTDPGERQYIDKALSGQKYLACTDRFPDAVGRITQLYGDSAQYDYRPYEGACDMVFVDGSHAYEYVLKDTETAFRLIKKTGVIVWHDYGVWPGVTHALEGIECKEKLGLRHIKGTSLAFWRHNAKTVNKNH